MNSAPVANPDSASTVVGTSITIDVVANDRDPDVGDTINRQSVVIVSQSANGTAVVLANGNIQFTPNPGFTGPATVTYTVADNNGLRSNPGNFNIDVVASLFQNPRNRHDVNNDTFVSPIDALIVINYLNQRPVPPLSTTLPPNFLDVDGNGFISPNDILQVINFLNARVNRGSAEGESGTSSSVVSLATPSINVPLSGTIFVEVLDQKSVQAYVDGRISNSSVSTKIGSAFSSRSSAFGDIAFDADESLSAVAVDITAEALRRKLSGSFDSALEEALKDMGIG